MTDRMIAVTGCGDCPFLRWDMALGYRCKLDERVAFTRRDPPRPTKRSYPCPLLAGDARVHRQERV